MNDVGRKVEANLYLSPNRKPSEAKAGSSYGDITHGRSLHAFGYELPITEQMSKARSEELDPSAARDRGICEH